MLSKISKKDVSFQKLYKRNLHLSGFLDICHETLTKGMWCPRYCCIKDGQLELYHEKTSDGVEMAFSLIDVDINSASKETKKDLSVKLSWITGDYILLDVRIIFMLRVESFALYSSFLCSPTRLISCCFICQRPLKSYQAFIFSWISNNLNLDFVLE